MKLTKMVFVLFTLLFSLSATAMVVTSPPAPFTPFMNPIHTQIAGQFDGWHGDTVFHLSDGQVWQQAEPGEFNYSAKDPHVTIYAANGCVRLQLEGQPNSVCVKPAMQ
ncbi:MAG TPA: hypothetical protein VGV92_00715 [Gammaproteobacteria bacterium]|nr:hypothetical protein [Gammaproteobacteria bacterium]